MDISGFSFSFTKKKINHCGSQISTQSQRLNSPSCRGYGCSCWPIAIFVALADQSQWMHVFVRGDRSQCRVFADQSQLFSFSSFSCWPITPACSRCPITIAVTAENVRIFILADRSQLLSMVKNHNCFLQLTNHNCCYCWPIAVAVFAEQSQWQFLLTNRSCFLSLANQHCSLLPTNRNHTPADQSELLFLLTNHNFLFSCWPITMAALYSSWSIPAVCVCWPITFFFYLADQSQWLPFVRPDQSHPCALAGQSKLLFLLEHRF